MIERKFKRTAKIALFAVAHGVYWEQFPGLLDNMKGFHKTLLDKVEANEVEVCDFGIVDSSEMAFEVAEKIRACSPDVVFCNMIRIGRSGYGNEPSLDLPAKNHLSRSLTMSL